MKLWGGFLQDTSIILNLDLFVRVGVTHLNGLFEKSPALRALKDITAFFRLSVSDLCKLPHHFT